jgi:putative ABC transport system permease protein
MSWRRSAAVAREGLSIALGSLGAHRMRTFLTTLGILIGVTTVIAIVAIIQGLNQSFASQIGGLGASTLHISKFPFLTFDAEFSLLRNRKRIGKPELRAVERESKLAQAVAPRVRTLGILEAGGREVTNVLIDGVGEQSLETDGGSLAAGHFPSDEEIALQRSVAVLGADALDMLFQGREAAQVLGERVRVAGAPYQVIGVLARRGKLLGMSLDKNVAIPWTRFTAQFGTQRSLGISVKGDPAKLRELEDELTGILRRVRQVPPGKPDDFNINRQEQLLKIYEKLTFALYGVAVGIGLITLFVGGIGIMNIMLVSVRERTREIGLRRALGARRTTILAQFLLEALLVSALGGSLGTAAGLGVAQLIALVSPLSAAVTPSAVGLGLGFSAAVGLLFGSWPAWRAATLDPVEALRYE